MISSPPIQDSEEQEQLQQTIEMFEVIVQASPQDCQSMEILRDAYLRLDRVAEASGIGRRLADTYVALGQFSQAMLQFERLLQEDPTNGEIIAALGELEERLHRKEQARPASARTAAPAAKAVNGNGGNPTAMNLAGSIRDGGTLMATDQTQRTNLSGGSAEENETPVALKPQTSGDEALARFLIQHKLAPDEVVEAALERVTKKNLDRAPHVVASSLIDEICRRGNVEMDMLLSGILDRSKFAYIPLEYYDVDRSIVKMLPEQLTLGRLIVPFDVMSRTLMVAMANPFDGEAKEAVQKQLDYNIQWHLAAPFALTKVLGETYKLGTSVSNSYRLGS